MSGLTKTATVLDRIMTTESMAFFHRRDDEEDDRRRNLGIDTATWVDLGRPDEITVTIEPGNTL